MDKTPYSALVVHNDRTKNQENTVIYVDLFESDTDLMEIPIYLYIFDCLVIYLLLYSFDFSLSDPIDVIICLLYHTAN